MQNNWIYLNGNLILDHQARVSLYDHGFLYGHGLFETMRVYNGKVFCLDDHLERLEYGSKLLGWPSWFSADELSLAISQTLEKNQLKDASLRLTVSRGVGASRPDPSTCRQLTIAIFAAPIRPFSSEVYEKGWSLATASIRRNLTSPLCSVKSANYLDNILAKAQAQQQGANEALLLNTNGSVAEGTMCNVFFVVEDRLITPDKASGLLPGITRAAVLKLAQKAGICVEERQVDPHEIKTIAEMFVTSSLLEIMPVTTLDGCSVRDGRPGKITNFLQQEYGKLVQSSCW